jgi:CDP-diacylglycerol--glycerol-3-phosphate 3-phosphatidyltransferase
MFSHPAGRKWQLLAAFRNALTGLGADARDMNASAPAHTRSAAGLYSIKPGFQRLLSPLADGLARRQVEPDALTYAAVGCGVLGGAALGLSSRAPLLLFALPVLIVARLGLNALDGMVATRRGVARPWGKVLNEVCDRLADLAFFWPLLLVPGTNPLWVSAALAAVLLVAFVGVLGEAVGSARQYGGNMGKADRMALLGVAAVASGVLSSPLPLQVLPVVLVGGSLLTLVQRLEAIHAAV